MCVSFFLEYIHTGQRDAIAIGFSVLDSVGMKKGFHLVTERRDRKEAAGVEHPVNEALRALGGR